MPSLEAINLTKYYGKRKGIENVNFKIKGKKCVGYLGPNGAGKTTTLKLFTNMLIPTQGKAIINGIEVKNNPKLALSYVGALIESPEIYSHFTIEDSLVFSGKIRGLSLSEIKNQIYYLKEEINLPNLNYKVSTLSKGQLQRVIIASILIGNPEILLLDEPYIGLDPEEISRIRNLILKLKKEILIFMSSHILKEVQEVCDEIIIINKGRIIVYSDINSFLKKLIKSRITIKFIRTVRKEKLDFLVEKELVENIEQINERTYKLYFDGNEEKMSKILEEILKIEKVVSFSKEKEELEEAYLKLVK